MTSHWKSDPDEESSEPTPNKTHENMVYINTPEEARILTLQEEGKTVFVNEDANEDEIDAESKDKIKRGYKVEKLSRKMYDFIKQKEKWRTVERTP